MPFLAGFSKEFFGEILDLFLECLFLLDMLLLTLVGSVDKCIEIPDRAIKFFDSVLQLDKLLVS